MGSEFGMLVGILAGLFFIAAGWGCARLIGWYGKHFFNVKKSTLISCASISQNLVPVINRLHRKAGVPINGSHLWVFGSDGSYFLKSNGTAWAKSLRKWANRGLNIKYVLLEMNPKVEEKFRELLIDIKHDGCEERVQVLVAKSDSQGPSNVVLHELDTCHPTLFFDEKNRYAAWIEGVHRRDSEFAYDVHYFSPGDLALDPQKQRIFDDYSTLVKYMMRHSRSITTAAN